MANRTKPILQLLGLTTALFATSAWAAEGASQGTVVTSVTAPYLPACKAGADVEQCHALALQIQEARCRNGSGNACIIVANVYRLGFHVAADANRAKSYYNLAVAPLNGACEHGDEASCTLLAGLYELGRGVATDTARAEALSQRAQKFEMPRVAEDGN